MKRGRDTERERDKESGCMLNNKNLFASHNSLAESQQGIPHEHKERRERILVLARPIRKTTGRLSLPVAVMERACSCMRM